jgi:predicted ATPase
LDGIPLALELASARVTLLSPEQISARLDDSLGLLVAGRRLAPVRQETVRATLDWSYALLTEPERDLFERLSVFARGLPSPRRLQMLHAVISRESPGAAATS